MTAFAAVGVMVTRFESEFNTEYAAVAFAESVVILKLLPVVAASDTAGVAGATAKTATVSVVAVGVNVTVTVTAVVVSPATAVPDDADNVTDAVVLSIEALDVAVDIKPNPKEATTTSAIRLKYVFVDIYFLSLVASKTFLEAAGEKRLTS